MTNVFWKSLELVIFDVDGTLYSQSKLRSKMMVALFSYYLFRPWKFKDLLILYHFRKERENRAGQEFNNLQSEQYDWCAVKSNCSVSRVQKVVNKWIFNFPNKYLKACMYPEVGRFFEELEKRKILIAIYSDYDSKLKLQSMHLNAALIVSSTDKDVSALKPMPNGLNSILSKLNIQNKNNCLFIGDRNELDGECAKLADIPFFLIEKEKAKINLYTSLSNLLNKG